jgi:hypothetical protein
MSAIHPKADIHDRDPHVRYGPDADKVHCSKIFHSITGSFITLHLGSLMIIQLAKWAPSSAPATMHPESHLEG